SPHSRPTERRSPRFAGAGSTVPPLFAAENSGDVAKLGGECERTQLLQALVLDLPDPLAGDVERLPDLVERPRLLAVEPVAELEHAPLAVRERLQDRAQRLVAERLLGLLVGQRHRLVGEEVPELGLVLVADGLLERDRSLRAAPDLVVLLRLQVELQTYLDRAGLATELGAQGPLRAHDLVQLLDDVHGHPNRAGLVGERPRDGLADPPRRVGRELESLAVVELL